MNRIINQGHLEFSLDQDLFDRNLASFKEHDPVLAQRLTVMQQPESKIIHPNGDKDTIDLWVDDRRYYNRDMQAKSKTDASNLLHQRNIVSAYTFDSASEKVNSDLRESQADIYLAERINVFFEKNIEYMLPISRDLYPTHVLVMGIGVGLIVEKLIESGDAKSIIIVDSSIENLFHSLFIVDYASAFEKQKNNKGIIKFFISSLSWELAQKIYDYMRYYFFCGVVCCKKINHDPFVGSQEFNDALRDQLVIILGSKGFFIDQHRMLYQLSKNLYEKKLPIIFFPNRTQPQVPCFVVGNGPSLNDSMETIAQYADRAVVISCGTTLSSLLAHHIVPDFHVESENSDLTYEILSYISEDHNLKKISIFHASTSHPSISSLFGKAYVYMRTGTTSFLNFHQRQGILHNSEPIVSNAGMALAFKMGFSEIYMFGVDMGTVDKNTFHARGSIYDNKEYFKEKNAEAPDNLPGALKYTHQANLGGEAHTNSNLIYSKSFFEETVKTVKNIYSPTIYNCSDGLFLKGTIPKLHSTVSVVVDKDLKQKALDCVDGMMVDITHFSESLVHFCHYQNPDLIRQIFCKYRQMIQDHATKVEGDEKFPLFDLFTHMEDIFELRLDPERNPRSEYYVHMIISGSLYRWGQYYYIFDSFLSPELRTEFADYFVETLLVMFEKAEEQLLEVVEHFAGLRQEFLTEIAVRTDQQIEPNNLPH